VSLHLWPHGDPNAVVHAILAEPAFAQVHRAAVGDGNSLFQHLMQWLGDLLQPVFRRLFEGSANPMASGALMVVLYVVAALAVLFIAAFIAETISVRLRGGAAVNGARRDTAHDEQSPEALRRQAAAAAEAGDFARAIALLFRAALLALDRGAVLAFDAARTPGEYRRLVRHALAPAASSFDEVATRFVHATFGTRNAERGDYEAAARAYAAFEPRAVT